MRALGVLFFIFGALAVIAPFKEGGIIGLGMGISGVLLWLSGFGAGKGWKYFPMLPLTMSIIALLIMSYGCFRSLGLN